MTSFFEANPRLPSPYRDESTCVQAAMARLDGVLDWSEATALATPWIQALREQPAPFWALESLLREYPISQPEGRALMRLAEALLRVPDAQTAAALMADQLGHAAFEAEGSLAHPVLAGLSAQVLTLSKRLLPADEAGAGLLRRWSSHAVVAAAVRAIGLLGRQFVLGRTVAEAQREAAAMRRNHPALRMSYDMLGEGARNDAQAAAHWSAYRAAIGAIAAPGVADSPQSSDGISIKLSALFARYEEAQRERVFAVLLERAWQLVDQAARANIHLTIDAEESQRLELSLDLFEALAVRCAREHAGWGGLGLAVQAYQTRGLAVVDEVARLARAHGRQFMVRLVKGAYWDSEVKQAQEGGRTSYPVYTHKHHTDISYLACAQALLQHPQHIYPQFATHNAGTVAAILTLARHSGTAFEMQRLHGMGEGTYQQLLGPRSAARESGQTPLALRVYAPVGQHRDLLAYLVRRLLENGANSSFVNQLGDPGVAIDDLLASPLRPASSPSLALPIDLFRAQRSDARENSIGIDLDDARDRHGLMAATRSLKTGGLPVAPTAASIADARAAMERLRDGYPAWTTTALAERVSALRRAADALQARMPEFSALLVLEAHKSPADAVAEVREAIDFCRYYADQAELSLAPQELPGPTGERNVLSLRGRGVFVCISPWNFPLAIFAGQVVAALVAGNAVAAKPAEQTPRVAERMAALLWDAGVPSDALVLLHGPGETVGAALVAHPLCAGVCFTGSTPVAKSIQRSLGAQDGPIVPLIAETGGVNAMLVDSTALPEQVIDAVVQSAFRSAGQRCSALRLLCVHEAIADAVIDMLRGAMQELVVGDPARLDTDVGPLIDRRAWATVSAQVNALRQRAVCVAEASLSIVRDAELLGTEGTSHAATLTSPDPTKGHSTTPSDQRNLPNLFAPVAFEIADMADAKEEIFGPVLQIWRWAGDPSEVIDRINALGYGLTLGLHTRIDGRALRLAERARAGNVYVNRNIIGAVVGVQPFGGEGLSGTGPKAGGPHYLPRFCSEQTVTINTAAAGGNVDLLAAHTH